MIIIIHVLGTISVYLFQQICFCRSCMSTPLEWKEMTLYPSEASQFGYQVNQEQGANIQKLSAFVILKLCVIACWGNGNFLQFFLSSVVQVCGLIYNLSSDELSWRTQVSCQKVWISTCTYILLNLYPKFFCLWLENIVRHVLYIELAETIDTHTHIYIMLST